MKKNVRIKHNITIHTDIVTSIKVFTLSGRLIVEFVELTLNDAVNKYNKWMEESNF